MSQRKAAEFSTAFFDGMYHWYYKQGGIGHVIAYLRAYDLSQFNPHEAPPKTAAFWSMVDIDRGPEFSELEDALDALGKPDPNDPEKIIGPDAVTIAELSEKAPSAEWLRDRKMSRVIPHRMKRSGCVRTRNTDSGGLIHDLCRIPWGNRSS
jgi:hypothetical protein